MKLIKNLTKLRVKSTKESSKNNANMNKKIGNSKVFSNIRNITDNGIIELKVGGYAQLFSVQAIDISLSTSSEQDSFYMQLRNLYLIKGLYLKQYKLEKPINFNEIEENLNYNILEKSNDENRLRLLEDQQNLLKILKSNNTEKHSVYYWVVISESLEKLQDISKNVIETCMSLNNPIYINKITNYLEVIQFIQDLYFQDNDLSQLLYNDFLDTCIPRYVEEKPKYLKIDDYYVQMLSITRFSNTVYKNFMDNLYNTPNVKSCISIYENFDTSKFINIIDYNYKSLKFDLNNSKKLSDITTLDDQDRSMQMLMYDLKNGDEQLKNFTLTLAIYAKTKEELKETYEEIKSYCSTSSVKVDICHFRQLEAWQTMDISSKLFQDYTKPQPSLTIASSFSNTRSHFLDPKGYYLGYDYSTGYPIYWDPFTLNKTTRINHNICVLGTSGSGKSFTIKKILADEYAKGDKIFILDVENEYGNFVKTNNGHFIDLFSKKGGMINPLQIRLLPTEDDEDKESNDSQINTDYPLPKHMGYLETFFKTAFEEITETQLIVLMKVLEKLYSNFNITKTSTYQEISELSNTDFPILSDLIVLIKNLLEDTSIDLNTRNIINELDVLLTRFSTSTDEYLFNGHTSIDLDNDIICFNLQELFASRNERLIQTQILSLLTYLNSIIIGNKIKNTKLNKKQNMIIAVDEFHIYSEYSSILLSLSQLCRRVRKYSAAFLFATQSIQDLLGNTDSIKYAKEIFSNCQYQFIGKLSEDDLKAYATLFEKRPLTDTQINFLSVSTQGQFLVIIDNKTRLLCCIDATDLEKDQMGESDIKEDSSKITEQKAMC